MFDAFKEAGFDNEQEQAVIGKRSVCYISLASNMKWQKKLLEKEKKFRSLEFSLLWDMHFI